MSRISAWIDAKPYRFQLVLLGHTAVFACAVLIAAGLFRTPLATPAERTVADARGFVERSATPPKSQAMVHNVGPLLVVCGGSRCNYATPHIFSDECRRFSKSVT